jgi:mRNA interferase RelE/StbE
VPYSIDFKPSVEKDLRSLPKAAAARIVERIEGLRDEPLPRQAIKLSGVEKLYRIRVGQYRIVYEIDLQSEQVTIYYVRHRKDVYRDL